MRNALITDVRPHAAESISLPSLAHPHLRSQKAALRCAAYEVLSTRKLPVHEHVEARTLDVARMQRNAVSAFLAHYANRVICLASPDPQEIEEAVDAESHWEFSHVILAMYASQRLSVDRALQCLHHALPAAQHMNVTTLAHVELRRLELCVQVLCPSYNAGEARRDDMGGVFFREFEESYAALCELTLTPRQRLLVALHAAAILVRCGEYDRASAHLREAKALLAQVNDVALRAYFDSIDEI